MQSQALFSQGMKNLANANSESFSDFYVKDAVKLLRLHNETIEALNRHRRGGEQRVIVQHVNVEGGGQAVVNGSFNGAPEGRG